MSNYRPISMVCNFSKILEKIVKSRLILYLEKNKVLPQNQFGVRPGRGTINVLYLMTKFIYEKLDNKEKVIVIFLDLVKAFDTVNHTELTYCQILK